MSSNVRLSRLGHAVAGGLLAAAVLTAPAAAAGTGTVQGTFIITSDEPISEQLQTGTIAGHFTDGSGQPVVAGVTAEGLDSWSYFYAGTDEAGAYRIDVPPGTYRVGFQWDSSRQFAFQAADENAAATITVTAGQTTTVDDHKLPTGTVAGKLTTADDSPLAGASVRLHRGGQDIGWATTDDNGDYSFGEALAGDGYTLSFSADGGAEQWVPHTLDPAQAQVFTVVAGEQTTVNDAQMATATVQGRLADPDGSPKAGYHVNVTLDSDNTWVNFDGVTDDNGSWSISGVYPGSYRVSFQTPDWGRTQWAYGVGTAADATLIAVEGGATVTVDDIWQPGATLVVNAVDAVTGAPVDNFCVWVMVPGDPQGCTTGSQVTISDLPGGSVHLGVSPGEGGYYLSNSDVSVTLTAGQTTTVSAPLKLGGKIEFTAIDRKTGGPVEQTCPAFAVLGRGGLGEQGGADCTDATGKSVTSSRVPGTYEIFAVAPGGYGHQWVGKNGGTGDQQDAAQIVVQPGKTVRAPTVRLDKAGTITGVVSDASGAPLGGGSVAFSAWGDAGPNWNTEVGADGRYTLGKLGPYAWPLLFDVAGYPRQWSGHKGNRFEADTIRVVAGRTATYNFTPVPGATLKGTVTVPSAPTATWRLNVVNATTGDQMGMADSTSVGAGTDGSYSIDLIGRQDVKIAWHYYQDDIAENGWYDHATDITTATTVTIPANGSTRELDLTLG